MGQGPEGRGKRVIKKKRTATRSVAKTSRKERSERSGSFHMKARREDITGEGKPSHGAAKKHVRDGSRVVDFGGKLTVLGGTLTPDDRRELLSMIENEGARAAARDRQNRILTVSRSGKDIVVTTEKNNLAVSIGKKLHRARKGGELTVTWSHHDLPVRVVWDPAT